VRLHTRNAPSHLHLATDLQSTNYPLDHKLAAFSLCRVFAAYNSDNLPILVLGILTAYLAAAFRILNFDPPHYLSAGAELFIGLVGTCATAWGQICARRNQKDGSMIRETAVMQ
jgi:hypothetical protein